MFEKEIPEKKNTEDFIIDFKTFFDHTELKLGYTFKID